MVEQRQSGQPMVPESIAVHFELNGAPQSVEVGAGESLLRVLRRMGMKSVKEGCGSGECGACTVLINGRPVRSCLTFAARVDGAQVTTLEGLGTPNDLHPLQQAFLEVGAVQCGFCTPGLLMASYALLKENPQPTREEVREYLAGNLCRCTGYDQVLDAVLSAAKGARCT